MESPARRDFLAALGGVTATALAGCSSTGTSDATPTDRPVGGSPTDRPVDTRSETSTGTGRFGTATGTPETPSIEPGTIPKHSLPPVANVFPDIDPLVVSMWRDVEGKVRFTGYPETPTDTLRFNALASGNVAAAKGAYLLSREEGTFVSELWLKQLQAGVEADWSANVAGVTVMYGSGWN